MPSAVGRASKIILQAQEERDRAAVRLQFAGATEIAMLSQ
jgi:hypothetical protein